MNKKPPQIAQLARFKKGIELAGLPPRESAKLGEQPDGRLIRGQALIFWDLKRRGRKLDAIDTDQITPG